MNLGDKESKIPFALVLGPHRSGSSITTKVLESLGCNLGEELLVGDLNYNSMGHFENLEVLNFHEELLKKLGTDWKNPNPLAGSGYFEENREDIENSVGFLLDSLIDSSITAVKEPRMSIFLDIWESQISKRNLDLKLIITIRHPSEVAYSMKNRDNLNLILGLQLWAQATLNAVKFA